VGLAKKAASNALSEIEFNNLAFAIKYLKDAIAILQPYDQ
jgi:hypothetical protein